MNRSNLLGHEESRGIAFLVPPQIMKILPRPDTPYNPRCYLILEQDQSLWPIPHKHHYYLETVNSRAQRRKT